MTILAVGADIKNRFLIGKGPCLYLGPQIGDLSDALNYERFKKEISHLLKKIKARPDTIAYDLHPGYFSTQFAKVFPLHSQSCRFHPVQHHHAHIASVMYEYALKKPVIGVAFDGTGFGTDGHVWGGEFLMAGRFQFRRLARLNYLKMPGGDRVVRQPWRMVLSILGEKAVSILKKVKKEDMDIVLTMLTKDINSPLTSSAGRLFDAAAALLGICTHASFEAEGPIKLEAMCLEKVKGHYDFGMSKRDSCYVLDAKPLFLGMMTDLKHGTKETVIATKFHNSIVRMIVMTVKMLSKDIGIKKVALSGGVFQNKFLWTRTREQLQALKFNVFTNEKMPVNDFNISWGQYYVSGGTGKN